MGFVYGAYGVVFESPFQCPELLSSTETPNVAISLGSVPPHLTRTPLASGPMFEAAPGEYLLRIDSVARYLVKRGNEIVVDRSPLASDDDVRAFLLTPVMGGLLHQRQVLPLHAAAIATADGCVLIAGHSGDGKSTLAAALSACGHSIMADDLAAVTVDGDGHPIVHAGVPRLKLWADSVSRLGLNSSSLPRVRRNLERYWLDLRDHGFTSGSRRLRTVYILNRRRVDEIAAAPLTGRERFNVLRLHTYARRCLEGQGSQTAHFRMTATVADAVPVVQIVRPLLRDSIRELTDFFHSELR